MFISLWSNFLRIYRTRDCCANSRVTSQNFFESACVLNVTGVIRKQQRTRINGTLLKSIRLFQSALKQKGRRNQTSLAQQVEVRSISFSMV